MRSTVFITIAAIAGASASSVFPRASCQDTYNSCLASNKTQVACQCDQTACLGEDDATEADFCASATAGGIYKTTTSPSSAATSPYVDSCQATYNTCLTSNKTEVACECDLQACDGEDDARGSDFCASATANGIYKTASSAAMGAVTTITVPANGTHPGTIYTTVCPPSTTALVGVPLTRPAVAPTAPASNATSPKPAASTSAVMFKGAAEKLGAGAGLAVLIGAVALAL